MPSPHDGQSAEPLLGAEAGTGISGLALVRHTTGSSQCSGALIASTLVVTAMHCLFGTDSTGDVLLDISGFRVGFGAAPDRLEERTIDEADWIGAPEVAPVHAAAEAGRDVAVVHLTQPAPDTEIVRDVALAFWPQDQLPVFVAGYGVSDLATGATMPGMQSGRLTGYDSATGVIAVEGAQSCFGDSGGPILDADTRIVLGITGELASLDGGFCRSGITLASTAANQDVKRLLAKKCAMEGGCGRNASNPEGRAAGALDALPEPTVADAGGESGSQSGSGKDAPAAIPRSDAGRELAPPSASDVREERRPEDTASPPSCGCRAAGLGGGSDSSAIGAFVAGLLVWARISAARAGGLGRARPSPWTHGRGTL